MASRVSPWRSFRNISLRTRPLFLAANQVQSRVLLPITCTRCNSDDISSRRPLGDAEGANAFVPPPRRIGSHDIDLSLSRSSPSASGTPSQPDAETSESSAWGLPANHEQPSLAPEHFAPNYLNATAIAQLQVAAEGGDPFDPELSGLRFDMPAGPGKDGHLQNRYHPVIAQLTRLLMKDGKLSNAQRNVALVLHFLRTSPAPKISPLRPLLPGSPPASHLPLNPVLYLTLAIESVAPIVRVKHLKGMAGGGAALELPEPLDARRRRRIAIMWILDAVRRKKSRGSGRTQFASRMADEIIAIAEGKSGVWDRRNLVHRLGTTARANLNHPSLTRRR